MTHRSVWIAEDMSCAQRGRSRGSPLLSGAHLEQNAHRAAGGTRWRVRRKDRQEITSVMSAKAKVLLWVLLSLLPLVEGAHMKTGAAGVGSDSGHAVGLLAGQEERELPVTLPEVVEDEEQEDDSDPYSTWHALYDPFVIDEMDDHPSSRWAGRSPRSSDPSEPQPKGSPKKKKKRKKKEKEEEEETGKADRKGKGFQNKLRLGTEGAAGEWLAASTYRPQGQQPPLLPPRPVRAGFLHGRPDHVEDHPVVISCQLHVYGLKTRAKVTRREVTHPERRGVTRQRGALSHTQKRSDGGHLLISC